MSRLEFNAAEVRRLVNHSRGKNHTLYGEPIPEKEYLYLVHDHGVYLMSGADERFLTVDAKGEPKSVTSYAKGCNPETDEDWYDTARDLVGGDDFGEVIPLLDVPEGAKKFVIVMTENELKIMVK